MRLLQQALPSLSSSLRQCFQTSQAHVGGRSQMKLRAQQGLWVCWLSLEDASKACTGAALLAHHDVRLIDRLRS